MNTRTCEVCRTRLTAANAAAAAETGRPRCYQHPLPMRVNQHGNLSPEGRGCPSHGRLDWYEAKRVCRICLAARKREARKAARG